VKLSSSITSVNIKERGKCVLNHDEYKRHKGKGFQHIKHQGTNVPTKKQGDNCK
jgi:hypothetical protein